METRTMKAPMYPRWEAFERKLGDGSAVYDLYFMRREGVAFSGAVLYVVSERDAYDACDKMNAAIETHCLVQS